MAEAVKITKTFHNVAGETVKVSGKEYTKAEKNLPKKVVSEMKKQEKLGNTESNIKEIAEKAAPGGPKVYSFEGMPEVKLEGNKIYLLGESKSGDWDKTVPITYSSEKEAEYIFGLMDKYNKVTYSTKKNTSLILEDPKVKGKIWDGHITSFPDDPNNVRHVHRFNDDFENGECEWEDILYKKSKDSDKLTVSVVRYEKTNIKSGDKSVFEAKKLREVLEGEAVTEEGAKPWGMYVWTELENDAGETYEGFVKLSSNRKET